LPFKPASGKPGVVLIQTVAEFGKTVNDKKANFFPCARNHTN